MTKLEMLEAVLQFTWQQAYNHGIDRGHDIAEKRYKNAASEQYRKGRLDEAKAYGTPERILDLNGGVE